jgi:hypothetical protein
MIYRYLRRHALGCFLLQVKRMFSPTILVKIISLEMHSMKAHFATNQLARIFLLYLSRNCRGVMEKPPHIFFTYGKIF